MGEDDLREHIQAVEHMEAELREALAQDTTPARRARAARNREIVRRVTEEGWTLEALTDHYHLSRLRITQILRQYQVPLKTRRSDRAERDAEITRAFAEGFTMKQIAELHGLSLAYIYLILRRQGVKCVACYANEEVERNRTIARLVVDEGWTYHRVAETFGISHQRVGQIVTRKGVNYVQRTGTRRRSVEVDLAVLHADHLAYLQDRFPRRDLLTRHGLSPMSHDRICREQGWPLKREYQATRPTKRCPACGVEKPATREHFVAKKGQPGFNSYCKPCLAAKQRAHKAARRAAAREEET